MPNPENILPHQFKKGESGNPEGRPIGSLNRTTIARRWLEIKEKAINPFNLDEEQISQADKIILALIKKAQEGDVTAARELFDSAFGKIPDKIIDETKQQRKLVIVVSDKDIE